MLIVKIIRSNTRDQKRNLYKVESKDGSLKLELGQDKYLWAKFKAGQMAIYCETWFDIKTASRRFGKIVTQEDFV